LANAYNPRGLAIDYIIKLAKEKSYRRLIILILIFFLLLVVTNIDFYGISKESFALSHFSLGNVYLRKGLYDKALLEYQRAQELAPCVPAAHLNRE